MTDVIWPPSMHQPLTSNQHPMTVIRPSFHFPSYTPDSAPTGLGARHHRPRWPSSTTQGRGDVSPRSHPAPASSPLRLQPVSSDMLPDTFNARRAASYAALGPVDPFRTLAPTVTYAANGPSTRSDSRIPSSHDRSDARRGSNGHGSLEPARRRKSSSANAIAPSLQIPPTINNSKGSLAEFAARVSTVGEHSPPAGSILLWFDGC